jgi:hypothetical protein
MSVLRRGHRWVAAALTAALCGGAAGSGAAQEGGGPMGQGQASINVRADIKLAIKGTRATPPDRVQQLTDAVSEQMAAMRTCYHDLVAKRPTTVGSIAMRITLEQGGEPALIETKEAGGTDPDLTGCVQKAVAKAAFGKVTRPAAAVVTLEFDNTRAKGQEQMDSRAAVAEQVQVTERTDGGFEAGWKSNDGKVGFVVSSAKSKEAVEVVLRTLRDGYAGFADCRRRSEKDGKSPAGQIAVQLQLQRGGKAGAKVGSSTVAHERAVPCVERVLKRIEFQGAPPAQKVDVTMTWSG